MRRTPYGVQIIINGTLNLEEALYALEKSLEMYAAPIGQAALNLGWREVDINGMQRIVEIFNKTGVRLLGVISTSLTTNRAAAKLGYTVVIGRVGLSEYQDSSKSIDAAGPEKGRAKAAETKKEAEAAEESGNGSLWTKSVEIELPENWRSHIVKDKSAQRPAAPPAMVERLPDDEAKPAEKKAPSVRAAERPLPPKPAEETKPAEEGPALPLQPGKGTVILLISGKGGVGTTSCTGCLGAALAAEGKSVLLIDGNGGDGHLHRILELCPADTADMDSGVCELAGLTGSEFFSDRRFKKLFCLPLGSLTELFRSSAEKWRRLPEVCKRGFDYTLVDMPPLRYLKHFEAAAAADRLTLVVNADILSVSAADRIISLFEGTDQRKINVLINRFDSGMAKRGSCLSEEAVREILDAEIVSVIPDDESVSAAVNLGKPFDIEGKGKAAEAWRRLAERIIDPQKKEAEASVSWLQKIGLIWGGKK